MKKQILAALTAGALILGCGCAASGSAAKLRESTAASTENYSVSGTEMSYYFNDVYNTFVSHYGSYVKYFKLDTEKSLKTQASEDGETWFDYFMGGAKSIVKDILVLNELAAKEGWTLTDAEKQAIKNRAYRMDVGLYGDGITSEDIYEAKLLEGTAYKYQLAKKAEFTPSVEELEKVKAAEPNKYSSVDYYSFPIYYRTDGANGSFTEAEAYFYTELLAEAKDEAEFAATVREILLAESRATSEEDIAARINKLAATGVSYTAGDPVSEWAFGENTEKCLIVHNAEKTMYTVYMLTSAPYCDETKTVNVRHVLLTENTWGTKDAAKAKAEDLYDMFLKSDGSAEAFALLALEYSDDESTCYNGGLYENLAEGMTVSAFDGWCFDEKRAAGDLDVMEGDYGWHLMFYEGDGLSNWQLKEAESIRDAALNEYLAKTAEGYSVTYYDDVINSIPG